MVLPGGKLAGEAAPAPADWSFAGDQGTFQLETNPEDAYSVNIAFTVLDGRLYVNAGDTETRWVKNMEADSAVRLRLEGSIYDARAVRVTDAGETRAFAEAWTSQSLFRRDPTKLDRAWIYRLEPR